MARISVQREPFDTAAELAAVVGEGAGIGAIVSFSGLCRDEGGALAALEIEHYPGMAEEQIALVADQAERRWPLLGVTLIHRYGRITPGEQIVLVIVASEHRADSFAAADYLMDYMKSRAPFWKREHHRDGTVGGWVAAKESDASALARWDLEESRRLSAAHDMAGLGSTRSVR
jgi:molybdopterin synthase catalytic subunit